MYTLYFDGGLDYKNRVARKLTLQKNCVDKKNVQGKLNTFYILSEKSRLFCGNAWIIEVW